MDLRLEMNPFSRDFGDRTFFHLTCFLTHVQILRAVLKSTQLAAIINIIDLYQAKKLSILLAPPRQSSMFSGRTPELFRRYCKLVRKLRHDSLSLSRLFIIINKKIMLFYNN